MVVSIRPIVPDNLNVSALRREIENALEKEGKLEQREFQRTTRHWTGETPKIIYEIYNKGVDVILFVGAKGNNKGFWKWEWLDSGTRSNYPITARRAPLLRFQAGYSAGSSPGTLSTNRASRSGPWIAKQTVIHPGIKARGWSETLLKDRQTKFVQDLTDALRRGLIKGGWAYT